MTQNPLRKWTSILLAALATLTLVSCSPSAPENNVTETTAAITEASTEPGEPAPYSFKVKTNGGLLLSDIEVILTDSEGNQVGSATTNKRGICEITLPTTVYTVSLNGLKAGYSLAEESTKTTATGGLNNITVNTAVIQKRVPTSLKTYEVGDILYDYTFTIDGEKVKLSELLETKKLVVINFWATWCGPCKAEFPAIEKAYAEYKDSVAFIALSISDDKNACDLFRKQGNYSFPMLPESGVGMSGPFSKGGIPLSIYIDRYGMYVGYDLGSDDKVDSWKAKFEKYTSDKYVQRLS